MGGEVRMLVRTKVRYQVRAVRRGLHMGRDRSGQGELKRGTAPGSARGRQAAAVRLDDRTADGQPHTSPGIFGRKECIEDLFCLLRGKSHTGITDRDQQLSTAGFRPDGKLASASHSLHGIDAVSMRFMKTC